MPCGADCDDVPQRGDRAHVPAVLSVATVPTVPTVATGPIRATVLGGAFSAQISNRPGDCGQGWIQLARVSMGPRSLIGSNATAGRQVGSNLGLIELAAVLAVLTSVPR